MYLKRIEIAGFKSFADRTIIEFNQGLTAVVGPNGSGKSNITEAIRWVLGEQSAKNLRGGTMPDVIFAGSSSRAPLNLAEVTLVLDNEERFLPIDFSEVSVTRRLTRSGDSDFFINKQSCRLKDIVNLFMDSGLGKESFSIISQGKVESIFNSKPEDRRGIFEEAAGVLKYKTRKKEAERRLFETEDNLNRVQDIIYELEAQLTPLKAQSDTAKKYRHLKEQLTEIDVNITVQEIENHKSIWDEKEKEVSVLVETIEAKKGDLLVAETKLTELKTERETVEISIEEKQRHLLEVTTQYEQLEGQKKVVEERQRFSVQNKTSYQETLVTLDEKETLLLEELEKLIAEKAELSKTEKELNQDVKEIQGQVARFSKSAKEQLEDLRSDYVDVMQQQTNINNDLKHLEKQYQQEMVRNEKDVTTYDRLLLEEKETKIEKETKEKQLEKQTEKVATLLTDFREKQGEFNTLKQQVTVNERQMYEALKILQQAQAKEKSLKDLQASYSGFYQGVRSVLKERENLGGIVGAVAELIEVPKEVTLAMEHSLGASAQHIITENEESARKAISYLKQKRVGRATFLPLTTIKPRQLNQSIRNKVAQHPGFIGVASELIQYDKKITQVIQNILGLTIIAKDLPAANELAKIINYQYRVVSLDGDVMNPGGSMTGGASKSGQNNQLFSQGHELKELEKQVSQMERLYETKEKEVRVLKESFQLAEETLESVRRSGEEARLLEQNLTNEVAQLEQRSSQQEKERRAFEYEKRELQRFLEDYQEEKEQLVEAQEKLVEKKAELDKLMSQTSQLEEENAQKKEEAQKRLNQKQSDLAVLLEKTVQVAKRQTEKKVEQEEVASQKNAILSQLDSQSTEHVNQGERSQEIQVHMEELKERRETISITLNELKETRENLFKEISLLDQEVTEKNQAIQEAMDAKTTLEVAKNRSEISLDTALTYLQEEYGLTYERGKSLYPFVEDFEKGKASIQELKAAIQALGVVNLSSIEQYEEVNERYQFLIAQQEDLVLAKNELFETMNEMDELVIKKFHEVFIDIREEFRIVFPNMFGGGHADLVLTDPTDLLHTGIDIIAQPPGKKLQSLSLLSGGERALTAIALLFAIIQARPVPFCILDEVEAALDDANVTRYGNYLRHFGEDTQFIVITHRKGTMEAANVLYGVTMQESGVSKIVSVHLEELENQEELEML
ncbi:chromosome segregation protein SMC [Vagococcus carniphilus]|uniref:chromosome segregation protein SMC n=1 Tax=Vagococcus carniphilus TaxID=218144 RepID=UPI0028927735|nr:chromosome segregation protein SMC [Vagococcus carniphilus]MDT2813402.1 chromosome segregation protein SMC [Vagococcus carniphilus]MDT2865180.1 chromosome segregation protein SMC [Vagococcus carniphilus]